MEEDFSGLEYDQESVSEEDVVRKTNNLLDQFNLPTHVTSICDITAALFVVLYESLFSDRLPGIVRQPITREDEIHNCQIVIDVLSSEVIKDNLSHIRGVDIVGGKVQSISNLIDIFTFLFEYVIKQIESDGPTDTEDDARSLDKQDELTESPELMMPVPVVNNFKKEDIRPPAENGIMNSLGSHGLNHTASARAGSSTSLKTSASETKGNNKKIPVTSLPSKPTSATEQFALSPIHTNVSNSLMGHGTLNSTQGLAQEREKVNSHFQDEKVKPKTAWHYEDKENSLGQFDFIGVRPAPKTAAAATSISKTSASSSHPVSSQEAFLESAMPITGRDRSDGAYASAAAQMSCSPVAVSADFSQNMSATAPLPYRKNIRSPERFRSTVGPLPSHNYQKPEKLYQRDGSVKGLSSSYADLHHMVQHTAAMTRAALNTSPLRSRERHRVPPSDCHYLTRNLDLGAAALTPAHPFSTGDSLGLHQLDRDGKEEGFQGKATSEGTVQDVSDLLPRETFAPEAYTIPPNTDYRGPTTRSIGKRINKQRPHSPSVRHQKDIYPSEPSTEREKLVIRGKPSIAEHVESTNADDFKDEVTMKEPQLKLSSKLQEMGKPMLANAQRQLEMEDRMQQRGQNFLKKLYEEEFDDVVHEVKNLVGKDHKLLKDMEEEYRKLLLIAAGKPTKKSKPLQKSKGFMLPKTKTKSQGHPGSKTLLKKHSTEAVPKVCERPISLKNNEELMPILLEEFPHLHLSEHTWHELWRRGIMQIENLTRAYEENKRRKSKAQAQLEEAARKHEVLASIIKKQMDHNQRMHVMKAQKQQQVAMNNKVQETRSQSARARRYYNEFHVRARSKMLKRRSKEELVFKNLFKDGLAIQKARIQEVQHYAREQREVQAKKRQDEIDSLENYYRDQFELLVGTLVKDREEMMVREKAHQKVLEQMKRDLRQKMEKEITDIQSEMLRDEDDTYFRQLEADRLRQELQMAKYQTRV